MGWWEQEAVSVSMNRNMYKWESFQPQFPKAFEVNSMTKHGHMKIGDMQIDEGLVAQEEDKPTPHQSPEASLEACD